MIRRVVLLVLYISTACISIPQELALPFFEDDAVILQNTGYVAKYSEAHEQAEWVAYQLTDEEVDLDIAERSDDFREDPRVLTGTATPKDYRGSGYDRGHLAPAEDMDWSEAAMSESFIMINISPQSAGLNRGIWKALENRVRKMAVANEEIYIVVGPVLTDGPYQTIGPNEIAVPKRFFKVILDYAEPEFKAIGFIFPNEKCENPLVSYAVSINQAEEITGIDFFYALEDDVEESLESTIDLTLWPEIQ